MTKFGKPVADVVPTALTAGGLRLGYMLEGKAVVTIEPENTGWDEGNEEEMLREWDELNAEPSPRQNLPPLRRK